MKDFRRLFSAAVLFAAMLTLGGRASASNALDAVTASLAGKNPAYGSFSGTVIEVVEEPNRAYVTIEDADEAQTVFITDTNTYMPEGTDVVPGAQLTGYYDTSRPMITIYPPQFPAVAIIAKGDQPPFVKVDRFDGDNLSYDGLLTLRLSDDTEIVTQSGEAYQDDITDKGLMVFYDISTRSIPAQTTPSKIIVLSESGAAQEPAPEIVQEPEITPEEVSPEEVTFEEGSTVSLVVNNNTVAEITVTLSESGEIIVPLHLVCEGLGVSLTWDDVARQAVVDGQYPVIIGENSVIIEDRTYVPLSFFTETMGLGLGAASGGGNHIIIWDAE